MSPPRSPEYILTRISPEPMSGCWIWLGASDKKGYGNLRRSMRKWIAHRWFYTHFKGDIPPGMTIDHLCRNTTCVNPDHLEPVTSQINTLRGVGVTAKNAAKTHCKHGHEFTKENTKLVKHGRACRICSVETLRAWRKAKRGNKI